MCFLPFLFFPQLKVREHPVLGPYVEALSTYVVNSFEDVEVREIAQNVSQNILPYSLPTHFFCSSFCF